MKVSREPTDIEVLEQDVGKFASLEVMAKTEGGGAVRDSLIADILRILEMVANQNSTLTHMEYISYGSELKTKLSLLNLFTTSTKKKNLAKKYLEEKLSGSTES